MTFTPRIFLGFFIYQSFIEYNQNNELKKMRKDKFTPENIQELALNEIFVFGSNRAGKHIGGAAYTAFEKFRDKS